VATICRTWHRFSAWPDQPGADPLDKQAIDDARVVLDKMGLVGRSNQCTRRPTLRELDRLMEHFATIELKARAEKPSP